MKKLKASNVRYHKCAERAVVAERQGNYQAASLHWVNAGNAASHPANKIWAAERMEFCDQAQANGWGVEHAGG